MDKSLNANKALKDIFEDMQTGYANMNRNQQIFAVNEIRRVQHEIDRMLLDHMGPDGAITRAKYTRIQKQLADIDKQIRGVGEATMNKIVDDSAKFAIGGLSDSFGEILGTDFAPKAVLAQVNQNVVEYVSKRFYKDGLVLSDRIWGISADIRSGVEREIRLGIMTGMSVSEMMPRVRKAFDAETWQIRRLVVTEGSTAYRTATAMSADASPVVDYLEIHKGRADKPHHMCTILSHQDNYGQGPGIFKPTDQQIYNPHPNCTSFLTPVVKDDYTLEGLRRRFGLDENGEKLDYKTGVGGTVPRIPEGETRNIKLTKELPKLSDGDIGRWMADMTDKELLAVKDYTFAHYADMNSYLRNGTTHRFGPEVVTDVIGNLESAIKKYELTDNLKVYRRMQVYDDSIDYFDMVGATLNDKGFVSTTVIDDYVMANKKIKFEIVVPKGIGRGAYVDDYSKYATEELEFIIQKDSSFVIKNVKKGKKNTTIVEMELLTND